MIIDDASDKDGDHWTTVWTAMPQLAWAEADHMPPPEFARFRDATLRQTIRLCRVSGEAKHREGAKTETEKKTKTKTTRLRLRLCNTFGTSALCITRATVGIPQRPLDEMEGSDTHPDDDFAHASGSRFVDPATLCPVLFAGGQTSATIAAGGLLLSDAVVLPADTSDLSISLYFADGLATPPITTHPGSRTQSWLCRGDQTEAASLQKKKEGGALCSVLHWYFLAGVEQWTCASSSTRDKTFVLLGDSITDGRCSTNNGNDRWPDLLRDRLHGLLLLLPLQLQQEKNVESESESEWSVTLLNQSAGGNCLLREGTGGPALLSRFDRDVLAQQGVTGVLVCGGVNDLGTAVDSDLRAGGVARDLITTYEEVFKRCTAAGLTTIFATITPFDGPGQAYASPAREAARQEVNAWVRSRPSNTLEVGTRAAVVDFDAVLRDPENPARLLPAYDSGDHLHPNVDGFRAMAEAFPVALLTTIRSMW
ncbi:MAG: hypothetical protein STHCBS139747_006873 [Sporothrix thermara]